MGPAGIRAAVRAGPAGEETDVGRGHRHGAEVDTSDVEVGAGARFVLLLSLAVVAVGTVVGLLVLWPDADAVDDLGQEVQFAAPGVTFPRAEITDVASCPEGTAPPGVACRQVTAELTEPVEGGDGPVELTLQGPPAQAGLTEGDTIQVMRSPGFDGQEEVYSFFGVDRSAPLAWFAGAFVLVVVLVARLRGLLALVGLGFAGFIVLKFMLPAILVGEPGVAVTLVAASAIIYVVLYLAHGPSVRTSTALAGTLLGVAITGVLGFVAVGATRLSGVGDDTSAVLGSLAGELDFRVLLTSAIIIAGLGVLNDVTITQSSAVWELRAAGPELTRRELFGSGMRIGRDHIASTIYTIVFAYAGASLSVLLLLYLYDRPFLDLIGTEDIAIEVARTLCSAIGLVLAVPLTTAIAALTVSGPVAPGPTVPDPTPAPVGSRP